MGVGLSPIQTLMLSGGIEQEPGQIRFAKSSDSCRCVSHLNATRSNETAFAGSFPDEVRPHASLFVDFSLRSQAPEIDAFPEAFGPNTSCCPLRRGRPVRSTSTLSMTGDTGEFLAEPPDEPAYRRTACRSRGTSRLWPAWCLPSSTVVPCLSLRSYARNPRIEKPPAPDPVSRHIQNITHIDKTDLEDPSSRVPFREQDRSVAGRRLSDQVSKVAINLRIHKGITWEAEFVNRQIGPAEKPSQKAGYRDVLDAPMDRQGRILIWEAVSGTCGSQKSRRQPEGIYRQEPEAVGQPRIAGFEWQSGQVETGFCMRRGRGIGFSPSLTPRRRGIVKIPFRKIAQSAGPSWRSQGNCLCNCSTKCCASWHTEPLPGLIGIRNCP